MADGKNAIVVYRDWKCTFDKLTDDEAGKLIKHFFAYVNDEDPISDRMIELIFEPFKQTLKRDLKKWENTSSQRSDIGRLGGIKSGEARRKQNEANEAIALNLKQNEANPSKRTDSDSVSVIDIETEIENIYMSYPSKCPINGSATGKNSKDKIKIGKLLKTISTEDIIKTIEWYLTDCINSKRYIKNFSTFLNNFPELPKEEIQSDLNKPKFRQPTFEEMKQGITDFIKI